MPRREGRGGHGARGRAAHGGGASRRPRPAAPALSEEQKAQVEALLAEVPALAAALHAAQSQGRGALLAALGSVTSTAEPVAAVFADRLGALSGEQARAAADVAHTLGELEPRAEVARQARRSRIRLRSAGIVPSLAIPAAAAPTALPMDAPLERPLLAEAYVSRSRETGELNLITAWQEGRDPNQLQPWAFLLDFWREGVKDVIHMEPMRRSRFQREVIEGMRSEQQATLVPLTWAQARRLVQDALAVNAWRGTTPAEEFEHHRAQFERLLLTEPADEAQAAEIAAEDERFAREGDRPFIETDIESDEMVVNWIGAWSLGDYGLAYDLLGDDHPIRRGQSRAEYVKLRRQWADEAQPSGLRVTVAREQERRAGALWVPGAPASAAGLGAARPELEAFWSLICKDVEMGGQFEELPMATLLSRETGRHWYWTGYTLERDRTYGFWLVARTRDEGAASQALTLEELQKRIAEAREKVKQITAQEPPAPGSEEAAEALRTISAELTAALHYADALAVKLPLDEAVFREALTDARSLGNHERAAGLIERRETRSGGSVRLQFERGIEEYLVADQYGRQDMHEAEAAWLDRAVRTLERVVEAEPTGEHLQGLGELLARQGHFERAIERLREGIRVEPDRAMLYSDLADALMSQASGEGVEHAEPLTEEERERLAREALDALREASTQDASIHGIYTRIGAIYDVLGQPEDALLALQEAVRHDPADAEARYALGSLHLSQGKPAAAVTELETAAQHVPFSVPIRLALASAYTAAGRHPEARRELDFIDRVQPGLPQVAELRARLARHAKK